MNSVANGKVYRNTPFKQLYVQAAAGDAGGAIGAAFVAMESRPRRWPRRRRHSFQDGSCLSGVRSSTRSRSTACSRRTARAICSQAAAGRANAATRTSCACDSAQRYRRRQGRRLVSGPHGMGSARARKPLHLVRSAPRGHEGHPEPARSSAGSPSGRLRPRCCASTSPTGSRTDDDVPFMMQVYPDSDREARAHPGGDARRRIRPAADRHRSSRTRATTA